MREMAESEVRFASASEEDIATLLSNKDSLNTKRATKVAVAVFQDYLHEKEKSTDFLSLPVEELKSYIIKQLLHPLLLFPEAAIIIQYSTPI